MMWPLPALAAWGLAWASYLTLDALNVPAVVAMVVASTLGAVLMVWGATPWRRVFIAAGFPMSLLVSGVAGSLPAWAWLLPLGLLVLLYPMSSWRDAPLFPTPAGALAGLAALAPLPADRASVVDAGCGVGDGLRELHREYPAARIDGLEWSWPLRIVCAWRCRFARVRRADIWTADWSGYGMVYLFQRPESMPRAVAKATRELSPGAWMASLEFEATSLEPQQVLRCPDGRPVWLYQAPFTVRATA
ncbi:MAG: class I SAM-dependent methyltransferase [Acidobacteria bacterium]|nr:class I SAM-dependent methyltransferase [Acidobacteriota bacterium]